MGEDQADVVAAAAEHGVEGVAEGALEGASGEAAQVASERRRHAAALAGDEHLGRLHAMTAVAAIDEGAAGAGVGEDLHLLERLPQGVAVVGGAGHRAPADDEALPVGGGDRDLAAELVTHPSLALRDAVDLGLVEGVNPDAVLAEIAATNAKLDALGLVLDGDPRRVTKTGSAQSAGNNGDADSDAQPINSD